jgi:cell division protein FtsB
METSMNATRSQGGDKAKAQGALTLAEIDALRMEVVNIKAENGELRAKVDALNKQLHDLTDPAQQAAIAAFRKRMRYDE